MLNTKKNFIYINAVIFEFGLVNAMYQMFLASYYCILNLETIKILEENQNVQDELNLDKSFLTQLPLFLMLTLAACKFSFFSFTGTIFDNVFGFRK